MRSLIRVAWQPVTPGIMLLFQNVPAREILAEAAPPPLFFCVSPSDELLKVFLFTCASAAFACFLVREITCWLLQWHHVNGEGEESRAT